MLPFPSLLELHPDGGHTAVHHRIMVQLEDLNRHGSCNVWVLSVFVHLHTVS